VWDNVKKQVELELEQLHLLLHTYRLLKKKCETIVPDSVEILALGAMLHSFYTGVENIFSRIAKEIDNDMPSGKFWHSNLLEQMSNAGSHRPAVLSLSLREKLEEYLDFRHVFRRAYSFQLQWEKMSSLVYDLEGILEQLEKEMRDFFESNKSNESKS